MSQSSDTRWWEGYLVRYLMPSIAGAGIILWLASTSTDAADLLLIPTELAELEASSLILLLLYANLLCYVSSLPILAFHASRAMDHYDSFTPFQKVPDPYIVSFIMLLAAAGVAYWAGSSCAYWGAFAVSVLYSLVQILRLAAAARCVDSYGFAKALGYARSGASFEGSKSSPEIDQREWWNEVTDSYRHMREHGNSGFIFLLQVAVAAFLYAVIALPGQTPETKLSGVLFLLAIWASPAAFVHRLGQIVEKRFKEDQMRQTSKATARQATAGDD